MSGAVLMACLWCVCANVIGMLPSKHHHWPAAYVLMTFGIPILGWVFWVDGAIIGMIFTVAGLSILRWPVRYLLRWLRTVTMRDAEKPGSV